MNEDKIILSGMVFYGYHGASSSEQSLGQRFVVDLEAEYDLRAAGSSDDLPSTVNYSHLFRAVQQVIAGPPVKLLEALADRIAAEVLAQFPVQAVLVRVKKPEVPIKASIMDYAAVEIYRRREGAK
jgi:dihydroneopterin aldolase